LLNLPGPASAGAATNPMIARLRRTFRIDAFSK
jgi:hypothetical protein